MREQLPCPNLPFVTTRGPLVQVRLVPRWVYHLQQQHRQQPPRMPLLPKLPEANVHPLNLPQLRRGPLGLVRLEGPCGQDQPLGQLLQVRQLYKNV